MMLIEHDLDTFLLRDLPFADVAVIECRPLSGVVEAVWEVDPNRLILIGWRQVGIGGFSEMPSPHSKSLLWSEYEADSS
jgi:hypothetical protein